MPKVEIDLGNLKDTCFVIMPFSSVFDAEYHDIIRPAVEAAGLTCIRADELYSKPQVIADIWKSLRSARVVIAELSGRNTNVFYELGVAHVLGKPVIIITRNQEDVPFDLKALRYLYYDINNPFWGQNLQKALVGMIQKLLKEEKYGTVFEGIRVTGEIKYKTPAKKKVPTPKKVAPLYNLTGLWQGKMEVPGTSYDLNLHIAQEASKLSGTMIVCFTEIGDSKKEELTVLQEIMSGEIKKNTAKIYGVSFTFLQQGLSSGYYLDKLVGKISRNGDKMTGESTDTQQVNGTFSLERKPINSEKKD